MTTAHYAARSGHLKILIYLDGKTDLASRDRFGYSVLHYSLMLNKVYCFIYLFFKKEIQFNNEVMKQTLMQMSSQ